jgi:CheY-like chemotaxis protein
MTKILLVEDDKSLREIYGVRLLAEGYDIVSAGDGEEALAMAIKERPTLIVSDVMMPKISGFDMLDILRSTTETKDIKVIMMTALSSEDQRARGQALGADRYLVKSQVGIEDVVRTVHEVLGDIPVANQTPEQVFNTVPSAMPRTNTPNIPSRQPAPIYQTSPAASQIGSPIPQQPATAQGGLPQPTAPFSTPRPANLGDRIIHPVAPSPMPAPDLGSLMDQELNSAPAPIAIPTPVAPSQPLVAPPQPQPAAFQPPTPVTEMHGASAVNFNDLPPTPTPQSQGSFDPNEPTPRV